MEDIPDQSIRPGKLVPVLEQLIDEMRAIAEAGILNAVNEDENRETAAIATQELKTHVDAGLLAEAEARTLLAVKLGDNVAYLQQLMQVVAHAATITEGSVAPASPQEGDIWVNGSQYWQWDGGAWTAIEDEDVKSTIAAVKATYSLLLDVNGNVAGFGVTNSNIGQSEFSILADVFKIGSANGKKVTVFQVDSEGNVYLRGDLFAEGSMNGNVLNARSRIQIGDSIILDGVNEVIQIGTNIVLNGKDGSFF